MCCQSTLLLNQLSSSIDFPDQSAFLINQLSLSSKNFPTLSLNFLCLIAIFVTLYIVVSNIMDRFHIHSLYSLLHLCPGSTFCSHCLLCRVTVVFSLLILEWQKSYQKFCGTTKTGAKVEQFTCQEYNNISWISLSHNKQKQFHLQFLSLQFFNQRTQN